MKKDESNEEKQNNIILIKKLKKIQQTINILYLPVEIKNVMDI